MKKSKLIAFACALIGLAAPAQAANFSFTGNLAGDDDVQTFTFTVGATSNVTLRTWSYAGGVNAAGDTIARGGFDPILALFEGTGPGAIYINQNDDGGSSLVDPDGTEGVDGTGRAWDTYLTATLNPGTYTVSVMQYSNFANGPTLGDGFDGSGVTGFTDVSGVVPFNDRDSHWAFDILNVEQATVNTPEGGQTLALLGLGLLSLAGVRKALVRK